MPTRSECSKSCQVSSTILIVSAYEKEEAVNRGTMHFATSMNDVLDLISSKSTCGQWSGIKRPPSSASPCINTVEKSLPESFPLVE